MQNGCTFQCSRFDHSVCQRLGQASITAAISATAAVATAATGTTAATAVTATTARATAAATAVAATTRAPRTATATVAAAATIAAARAATAAEATWAFFTGTGFIDDQGSAFHLLAIHAVDRRLRFGIRAHLDEAETLGATGFTVHHDLRRRHGAELSECLLEIVVSYVVRQVTDVEFVAHCERLSLQRTQNTCVASTYPDPFKQRRCY